VFCAHTLQITDCKILSWFRVTCCRAHRHDNVLHFIHTCSRGALANCPCMDTRLSGDDQFNLKFVRRRWCSLFLGALKMAHSNDPTAACVKIRSRANDYFKTVGETLLRGVTQQPWLKRSTVPAKRGVSLQNASENSLNHHIYVEQTGYNGLAKINYKLFHCDNIYLKRDSRCGKIPI